MGRKLGLTSLFYKTKDPRSFSSWHWPSCKQARTSSFRIGDEAVHQGDNKSMDSVESVIHGLRSADRLFFEPGGTSSIMEDARAAMRVPFEGSHAVAMESDDPYHDFRASMEEMVVAHGVKGWGWLEELLGWYLRVNGRKTHGFIVGAFMDLLLMLASPPPSTSCSSTSFSFEIKELEQEQEEEDEASDLSS
ncbi:Ovate protein family C-terminal protein [Dioscorea alata]|uniref:Ovate protein family C-terminal protein n=1 Tax=Dioscorea alata TaxID=55571 RepID=A0ACB7WC75_DIOAL|nr:Ovate protein family C-terminal protein [Dioscorea alata]